MKNQKSSDYDKAYRICKQIVLSHYENFPVASLLLPRKSRKHIYGIYAFARTADDIADSEILDSEVKLKMLNELESQIDLIDSNNANEFNDDTSAIFTALQYSISELGTDTLEFRKLLTAFKQDAVKNRYEDFSELLSYSENSANPIGHLVLHVFGYDPKIHKVIFECSDKICTALQLTNFWQDVGEDLKIDRVYIPENSMKEFGYDYNMLTERKENPEFKEMMKFLVRKTMILLEEGKEILNHTKGKLKAELKATISGGEEILKMIERNDYNVLSKKVKLNSISKLKIMIKAITG